MLHCTGLMKCDVEVADRGAAREEAEMAGEPANSARAGATLALTSAPVGATRLVDLATGIARPAYGSSRIAASRRAQELSPGTAARPWLRRPGIRQRSDPDMKQAGIGTVVVASAMCAAAGT